MTEIEVNELKEMAKSSECVRDTMTKYTLPSDKSIFLLGDGSLVNLSCAGEAFFKHTCAALLD